MKHFSPLWSLIPGAALIAGCGSQPKDKTSEHSPQKPNVVYLIADDLGIGDLSCYGATKVSTPNIDRLAGQGMQFTNAYATSSTSTPSRFGLLTGMYPWRQKNTGIAPGNSELIIDTACVTMADMFKEEEESFLRTLETGIRLLDKTMEDTKANGKTEISGKDAFTLYDTFGFPLDLTELILRENGMTVNIEEFNEEMQQQKQRARNAAAIETGDWIVLKEGTTEFVGYDYTEYEASILRYRQIKQKNQTLYQIVLDYTPFYAESGGQVGDTGVLVSEFETIEVVDTKKENNLPIHITKKLPEHPEAPMMACVDTDKRAACAANHSATHLLDAALREVLGEHIEQKGSLVTPDSLRFDFSHFQKVTDEEIRKVEHIVNARIRANIPLKEYRNIPIEEAKELGAIALFGEKYGDRVRVIQFGTSIEFCGGTHVAATGNIGMVKIISESSVAAGVRRIEAYTGARVEEMLDTIQDTLSDLKALFNNAPDLGIAIRKYLDENAGLKKQVEDFMKEKEAALKERLLKNIQEIHGIKVVKFFQQKP